jgi:hypothetical protein
MADAYSQSHGMRGGQIAMEIDDLANHSLVLPAYTHVGDGRSRMALRGIVKHDEAGEKQKKTEIDEDFAVLARQ